MNRFLRKVLLALTLGVCLLGWVGLVRAAGPEPEETAAAEHEEKSEGHEHELLFKVINFAILVGGLGYVLRKPLANFFVQRSA